MAVERVSWEYFFAVFFPRFPLYLTIQTWTQIVCMFLRIVVENDYLNIGCGVAFYIFFQMKW